MTIRIAFLLAALLAATSVFAVEPDEILDDPALEERARALSLQLRCLVCQNQSIDDSDADLAKDLRVLLRERLVAGDSDQQVLDFMVERYGKFVLLKPPLDSSTYILWFTPFLLAAGAVIIVVFGFRRQPNITAQGAQGAEGLSGEEEEALARILKERE